MHARYRQDGSLGNNHFDADKGTDIIRPRAWFLPWEDPFERKRTACPHISKEVSPAVPIRKTNSSFMDS